MTTIRPESDFWASLSVDQEDAEDAVPAQEAEEVVAPTEQPPATEEAATAGEVTAADTAEAPEQAEPAEKPEVVADAEAVEAEEVTGVTDALSAPQNAPADLPASDVRVAPVERTAPDTSPDSAAQPEPASAAESPRATGEQGSDSYGWYESARDARSELPVSMASSEPYSPPPADLSWVTAERIAEPLVPGFTPSMVGEGAGAWLQLLTERANGDREIAAKVYDVLTGWHLLGELWRDERVNEIHIRGTQVTVAGTHGVRSVPGFLSRATARRTIEAIGSGQPADDMIVSSVGESVVISRRESRHATPAKLVAEGVISATMLSVVELALARTQSVTVKGAAAPAVVRVLASLIPVGSRIFEGPYAVLPAGCIAAASPLDADYAIGVRLGGLAEEMAAEGQIGALIANPETPFKAAVQLVVSGRTAAPRKVTSL